MKLHHPILTLSILLTSSIASADDNPTSWEHAPTEYAVPAGLARGAAFIDRLLPMPVDSPLRADVWGGDNVKPRNAANGIEDPAWSYWCMSLFPQDGKEHMFATRWPESAEKGHMEWPRSSIVHAVADKPTGPFKVIREIGPGHNVMHYRTRDGTHVLYVIGRAYKSRSIDGPWVRFDLEYDTRGFEQVAMSNHTFTIREDGSYLMISRGGHTWVSRDGLQPYRKINTQTPYPPVKGRFEDPVVWRDEVQYHMVVNDWFGRTAFYARSRDGVDWTWDPGKAYDISVGRNADGTNERWYKFERPNVRQDEFGRATHFYLAVIDSRKDLDKGSDDHSSKIIALPMVLERRLEILDGPAGETRIRVKAEPGFQPATDLDTATLRFGAPSTVDFGGGLKVAKTEADGSDLVLVFGGGDAGFTPDDYAGKLLGRDKRDGLVIGFARLPGHAGHLPILSPSQPVLQGRDKLAVTVENFGLVASQPVRMKVVIQAVTGDAKVKDVTVAVPALAPYAKADLVVPLGSDWLRRGEPAVIDLILPSPSGVPLVAKTTVTVP
jgi:hypothetical protein